jgi:2-oxoglutarate dehydrogenase complex dehydrogenase (E1) component-like enzyme
MGPGTSFEPVLDDVFYQASSVSPKNILITSGQFYYTLVKERERLKQTSETVILRVEELSPFPLQALMSLLAKYVSKGARVAWVQEEPANAGAWIHVFTHLFGELGKQFPYLSQLQYIGRPALASVAVGLSKRNSSQTASILEDAFKL